MTVGSFQRTMAFVVIFCRTWGENISVPMSMSSGLGVFGIPTFAIGDELCWDEDVTAMILDHLDDPTLFQQGNFTRLDSLPTVAERKDSRLS